ncbi:hypothetical protein ICN84_04655 [Akkermansia glycaniphila]|uniref:hypothetical protein n=1 Tax=Akkermansia glycaniphila TaxID=1679444 RepID=UPI001C029CED|nr:hypothetical protein [Akkermansia glycaniphila]MBT9449364.1 hypothetical protein [Akkermansia glycaniphila]
MKKKVLRAVLRWSLTICILAVAWVGIDWGVSAYIGRLWDVEISREYGPTWSGEQIFLEVSRAEGLSTYRCGMPSRGIVTYFDSNSWLRPGLMIRRGSVREGKVEPNEDGDVFMVQRVLDVNGMFFYMGSPYQVKEVYVRE